MLVHICVFSGTGNTLKVCELLADKLAQLDCDVTISKIDKNAQPDNLLCDRLIVAYPVHAFNAPTPVTNFLKKLPRNLATTAYIVQTSGEPLHLNFAAAETPRRMLQRRGCTVLGCFDYVMPYNIMFRHSDGMASRMWRAAKIQAEADAQTIADGTKLPSKVKLWHRPVSALLRIEHLAMPLVGKHFSVNENCIDCGKCITACPQNNIAKHDGKIKFGGDCIGCMGCVFNCPANAIVPSLFLSWRVNGQYDTSAPPATDEEICNFCKQSYLDYFHNIENSAQQNQTIVVREEDLEQHLQSIALTTDEAEEEVLQSAPLPKNT